MFKHNNTCINCNMSDSDDYQSCWCDKIGGKVWRYSDGGCEDFYNIQNTNNLVKVKNKKYKQNRYSRKMIGRHKLKKLYQTSLWTVNYNEEENRYIRCYYSGRKGFAKWCSDKAVRNSNNFPLRGAGYRKCFNYWYTVF